MTRWLKIAMMICVGLWGLFGGMGNLLDYDEGVKLVAYVMSMEGAGDTDGTGWRSIHSPVLAQLGYVIIYGAKFATGVLCLLCAWQLLRQRGAPVGKFQLAKRNGILGLGISIGMLFLAFITIAGLFFEYWRVPTYGLITHQYAAIYLMCLLGFLLFLVMPDPIEE